MGDVIWYPMSRIIRDFLVQQGVGPDYSPTGEWPIATAAAPKSPANCIIICDETPLKKGRTVGGVIEDPVVSIEVRSERSEPGQYKAKQILAAMDSLCFWSWVGDSTEYGQTVVIATARRARGIFPMGVDENNRFKFNLEYALVIQSVEGD